MVRGEATLASAAAVRRRSAVRSRVAASPICVCICVDVVDDRRDVEIWRMSGDGATRPYRKLSCPRSATRSGPGVRSSIVPVPFHTQSSSGSVVPFRRRASRSYQDVKNTIEIKYFAYGLTNI
eukprot:scaffold6589_cov116-Isochrysis_galbana.AAC.3